MRKFKPEDMKGEWLEYGAGMIEDETILAKCINLTAVDDGKVVACGGVTIGEDVVFWMSVKKNIKRPVALIKAMQEALKSFMANLDVDRAITYIRDGFKQAEKLDILLGFRPTGEQVEFKNRIYNRYEICRG